MKDARGHGSDARGGPAPWTRQGVARARHIRNGTHNPFDASAERQHLAKYGGMSDRQLHQTVLNETANVHGLRGHGDAEKAPYVNRINAAMGELHSRNVGATPHNSGTIDPIDPREMTGDYPGKDDDIASYDRQYGRG